MAAPLSITLKNLSGQFLVNKKLTGEFESILVLQGISWLLRKTIAIAAVTLHINQYTDDKGIMHIDIEQVASGGIKGTSETRIFDGDWHPHSDYVFGTVSTHNKWIKLSSLNADDEEEAFLKNDWTQDTIDADDVVYNEVKAEAGWYARQTWGFEVVDGERRYVRHGIVKKDGKTKMIKMVYDYKGPLETAAAPAAS